MKQHIYVTFPTPDRYAMTFKVSVVHPTFVLEAWERRNEVNFSATSSEFSRIHLLKAFDGQRICFFGFAPDEHQHMVEILKANGGIPTTLEDPECSHVVSGYRGWVIVFGFLYIIVFFVVGLHQYVYM